MGESFGQLEQLWISQGGNPAKAADAAAVALAESSGNPTSLNNDPNTQDYSVGLWQVNYFGALAPGRTAAYGSPQQLLSDVGRQAYAAVQISGNGANWYPWHTDAVGAYLLQHGNPDLTPAQAQQLLAANGLPTGGSTTLAGPAPSTPGAQTVSSPFPGGNLDPLNWVADAASGWSQLFVRGGLLVFGGVLIVVALVVFARERDTRGGGRSAPAPTPVSPSGGRGRSDTPAPAGVSSSAIGAPSSTRSPRPRAGPGSERLPVSGGRHRGRPEAGMGREARTVARDTAETVAAS